MNAVIYARFSSQRQNEQSIEDQISDCIKYAEFKGYNIIGTYADRAKSGRSDNRAEFQKMLKDSKNKTFEIVLVWKLDRFGRNREEMAVNKLKLKKNGVRLESVKEDIPNTPEGVILESVMEGLAEYYSLNLAQNVKRGMKSNAEKAMPNGLLPLGYKNDNGKIVVDENYGPIIKEIFRLYINGFSITEIVNYLNSRGFRTRKNQVFKYPGLKKILKNRRYTGTYIYGDTIIENAFEPLISEEDFLLVQNLEKRNSYTLKSNEKFLLSGLVECGKCNAPFIADAGTSYNGNVYRYYCCKNKKRKEDKCTNKSIRKEFLEQLVIETTINDVLNKFPIKDLAQQIYSTFKKQKNSLLPQLEAQKMEVDKRIENLLNALEVGDTQELIFNRIKTLQEQQRNLRDQIILEKRKNPLPTLDAIEWTLNNFKSSYINSEQDKIVFINNFINKIIINDKILTIYYSINPLNKEDVSGQNTPCSTFSTMVNQDITNLNKIIFLENGVFYYSLKIA